MGSSSASIVGEKSVIQAEMNSEDCWTPPRSPRERLERSKGLLATLKDLNRDGTISPLEQSDHMQILDLFNFPRPRAAGLEQEENRELIAELESCADALGNVVTFLKAQLNDTSLPQDERAHLFRVANAFAAELGRVSELPSYSPLIDSPTLSCKRDLAALMLPFWASELAEGNLDSRDAICRLLSGFACDSPVRPGTEQDLIGKVIRKLDRMELSLEDPELLPRLEARRAALIPKVWSDEMLYGSRSGSARLWQLHKWGRESSRGAQEFACHWLRASACDTLAYRNSNLTDWDSLAYRLNQAGAHAAAGLRLVMPAHDEVDSAQANKDYVSGTKNVTDKELRKMLEWVEQAIDASKMQLAASSNDMAEASFLAYAYFGEAIRCVERTDPLRKQEGERFFAEAQAYASVATLYLGAAHNYHAAKHPDTDKKTARYWYTPRANNSLGEARVLAKETICEDRVMEWALELLD